MEYTAGLRLLGIYSPYMALSSSFVSSLVDLADNWKRQLTLEETETLDGYHFNIKAGFQAEFVTHSNWCVSMNVRQFVNLSLSRINTTG